VNVCTSISCFLNGGDELLEHAEERLGTKAGGTSEDGLFTIEGYECIAACTEAPCLQVNYRYFHKISNIEFNQLIDDLRAGRRSDIPPHGTLALIRQRVDPDRVAGVAPPDRGEPPVWLRDTPALQDTPK
jgi:NADH-quinone oxidoreductase subunit E